jgi:hypothetical protein
VFDLGQQALVEAVVGVGMHEAAVNHRGGPQERGADAGGVAGAPGLRGTLAVAPGGGSGGGEQKGVQEWSALGMCWACAGPQRWTRACRSASAFFRLAVPRKAMTTAAPPRTPSLHPTSALASVSRSHTMSKCCRTKRSRAVAGVKGLACCSSCSYTCAAAAGRAAGRGSSTEPARSTSLGYTERSAVFG